MAPTHPFGVFGRGDRLLEAVAALPLGQRPGRSFRQRPDAESWTGLCAGWRVFGDGGRPAMRDLERGLSLYVVAYGLAWLGLAVGAPAWLL